METFDGAKSLFSCHVIQGIFIKYLPQCGIDIDMIPCHFTTNTIPSIELDQPVNGFTFNFVSPQFNTFAIILLSCLVAVAAAGQSFNGGYSQWNIIFIKIIYRSG